MCSSSSWVTRQRVTLMHAGTLIFVMLPRQILARVSAASRSYEPDKDAFQLWGGLLPGGYAYQRSEFITSLHVSFQVRYSWVRRSCLRGVEI